MIRVLHTGDWHIGQTLRGFSRESEHEAVFGCLESIVVEREVDALVVAGDVFDSQNPSGESQARFYALMARLHAARPAMTIVITAGNHDAAGRLEAPRPLLEAIGVHVVGNVRRRDGAIDLERHLVPVRSAGGEVAAQVLAVSYPTAACLPPLSSLGAERRIGETSPIVRAVRDLYGQLFEAARPRLAGLPLLVTGHLHVAGGLESEGAERRILVGGEHAVPADVFPEEARYVALGHLHRAQGLGGGQVRYCGSLIPLSAAEQPYRHGVTLVTLGTGAAEIEHIEIPRPVPFLRLPASGDMPLADLGDHLAALTLDPDLPLEARPYIQVRLAREGLLPGYRAEVDRIAESFPVRVVDVRVSVPPRAAIEIVEPDAPPPRLSERDPEELFRLAYRAKWDEEPEPAHLDVFHRARAEA
ncbi:MAG TPA: exonuclease SbcCD subunit D [Methylobacterium sp.]|uniref:exonuclease SbcCD subunit D n=1 Tax=Methylorubrum sp. B1-46 TaxID=2897334 RepID=UPI001E52E2FB|nr:exonuclease SbcCD subunit D [Methylorubrum sp. B1-46]UGB26436.1 exonuclease SbcCD subunit D C-terminal domain-containing protein [Methylorubrum sp. B1-46]HEV2542037.1 exonuclease SbcCD subunit D [Methylobacterium sp.]